MPVPRVVLRGSLLHRAVSGSRSTLNWLSRGLESPAADPVKRKLLKRFSGKNVSWIETGTYLGDTTAVLARTSRQVNSIEPNEAFYQAAKIRFADTSNIHLHLGTSEQLFPTLLSQAAGPTAIYLDGHYSGGDTYRGRLDTPIRSELQAIGNSGPNDRPLAVLIDDFRCFRSGNLGLKGYPLKTDLVRWADELALTWTVEFDIFICFSHAWSALSDLDGDQV